MQLANDGRGLTPDLGDGYLAQGFDGGGPRYYLGRTSWAEVYGGVDVVDVLLALDKIGRRALRLNLRRLSA